MTVQSSSLVALTKSTVSPDKANLDFFIENFIQNWPKIGIFEDFRFFISGYLGLENSLIANHGDSKTDIYSFKFDSALFFVVSPKASRVESVILSTRWSFNKNTLSS